MKGKCVFVLPAVALMLAACGGERASSPVTSTGAVQLRTDAIAGLEIEGVVVSVMPAGSEFTLEFDAEDGSFVGVIELPPGEQTLTARAYSSDGSIAATGAATVTFRAGQTIPVRLVLYADTPEPPEPDHGPLITSLTASKIVAARGERLTFSARGIDPDGDPLEWRWDSTCSPESFSAPGEPTTEWASLSAGTCTISVTVSSKGLSAVRTLAVLVEADGQASLTVTYEVPPVVTSIGLATEPVCDVTPSALNATCAAALLPRQTVDVQVVTTPADLPSSSVEVSDDCGGSVRASDAGVVGATGPFEFTWTAPPTAGAVCRLTARVSAGARVDELTLAILIATPDVFETFDLTALRIAAYRSGKKAAASYTFDDGVMSSFAIADIFESKGMRASFYVIPGFIRTEDLWGRWRDLVARGHEVGNHSMSHLDLSDEALTDEVLSYEIEEAQRVIEQKVGVRPSVFVFPFSKHSERSKAVALRSHLATRTAGPFSEAYRPITLTSASTLEGVNSALMTCIAAGSWCVAAGHGIDGNGWEPITSALLTEHLAFAAAKPDLVWVDTFRNVAEYRLARERVRVTATTPGAYTIALRIEPGSGQEVPNVPLTVELPTRTRPDVVRAYTAAGEDVSFNVAGSVLRLDILPNEDVTLELAGHP